VFNALLNYMSIQKFRTPKGLKYLSTLIDVTNKNSLLLEMQRLQNWHCAIWTESIWALVDANNTETKLIISDHPVTVYNREIFPEGQYARKFTDPDFRMSGTQTLFPLSPTRLLVMTNLSWARNPYGNALEERPNPKIFRQAMFKFTAIQMGRELDETEVNQINYIIKRRAARYVAAAKEEWLYPEQKILTTHWRKLDIATCSCLIRDHYIWAAKSSSDMGTAGPHLLMNMVAALGRKTINVRSIRSSPEHFARSRANMRACLARSDGVSRRNSVAA
jgi:hypothetical protein